jgi:ubiquinone/menaquinone biosynthesis C-methylase UbiE
MLPTVRNKTTAREYWENNPNVMYIENTWTSNPLIAQHVYNKISGGNSSKHWLNWVLEDYFGHNFSHAICPGCGSGGHEIAMLKSGFVNKLDAFDFSRASIDLAINEATREQLSGANFYVDNLNEFRLDEGVYDLACFTGSLHHTSNIEHCLEQTRWSLKKNGFIIVWEYVGPCYLLWRDEQIKYVNKILKLLPSEFKLDDAICLGRRSLAQQLNADPSEAVRSAIIPELLREYFDIEYEQGCGGTILQPLYPFLNHQRLIQDDAATNTILNLVIEFEDLLIESGVLGNDFRFFIGKK